MVSPRSSIDTTTVPEPTTACTSAASSDGARPPSVYSWRCQRGGAPRCCWSARPRPPMRGRRGEGVVRAGICRATAPASRCSRRRNRCSTPSAPMSHTVRLRPMAHRAPAPDRTSGRHGLLLPAQSRPCCPRRQRGPLYEALLWWGAHQLSSGKTLPPFVYRSAPQSMSQTGRNHRTGTGLGACAHYQIVPAQRNRAGPLQCLSGRWLCPQP